VNHPNRRFARTALLATLLLPLLTAPLTAQWAPAPRIAVPADLGFDHAAFLAGYEPDFEPAPARRAPAIRGQFFAGFAGLIVGATLGVGTGLMLGLGQDDSNGFEAVALTATLAGILGGTTYGVYKFSQAKGANGRALPTFGGAALGLIGGPVMWVTVPLGARWAYNRSRTDSLVPMR
jgi:hypothetical protein